MVRAVQRLLPGRHGGITVLAYHLVGGGTEGPVDLDQDVFQRQMEELAEIAEVVHLREAVVGESMQPQEHAKPLVALTFDDAYANFFDCAWPLLEELRLPATLFVPVGFIEGTMPPPIAGTSDMPPARWEDLTEASATGILRIGAHSWTHRDLRELPHSDLDHELGAARRRLSDQLDSEIDVFCYPRGLWNRRVEQRVAAEYVVAVIGGGRRWVPPQSPWRVQRISLRRDGPISLAPLFAAPIWLEEWAADQVRRARPPARITR